MTEDLYLDGVEVVTASLRGELKTTRAANRKLVDRVTDLEESLSRYTVADPHSLTIPQWHARNKPRKKQTHTATPILMLSDLHLDEVVNPLELNGANAYNRKIAEARLKRIVDQTIELCQHHVGGVSFDGIVVALLGDVVTGVIHDELARTNEAPVMATVAYWVPILASAIVELADAFGHVFVPCVDGNHDRFYMKMSAKQRAESSIAWVVYNWLAGMLEHDSRITFKITPAPEQVIKVHNTSILLSHGDGFRSGGGVGGIYPAMLKWIHRKHQQFATIGLPWDYCLMGHWHQELIGPDFIVNGSLKGYDEYAASHGFQIEAPSQHLFIVTPERGITHHMTVYAEDPT